MMRKRISRKYSWNFLHSSHMLLRFFFCFLTVHLAQSLRDLSSLSERNIYVFLDVKRDTSSKSFPTFLKVPTTVTVYENSNVILSCRIDDLEDRMVFWIRNSDLQILTAGLITFTTDTRFKVNYENSVDETDWSLLITNVKMEDQGQYECQINTEPKMKLNINLMVKGEEHSLTIIYSWLNEFTKIFHLHILESWECSQTAVMRHTAMSWSLKFVFIKPHVLAWWKKKNFKFTHLGYLYWDSEIISLELEMATICENKICLQNFLKKWKWIRLLVALQLRVDIPTRWRWDQQSHWLVGLWRWKLMEKPRKRLQIQNILSGWKMEKF